MKRIKLFSLLMMTLVLLFAPLQTKADENADIIGDSYITMMKVNKDGTIDVDIEYNVTFNVARQGIYVLLPQVEEMEFNLNGEQVHRTYLFPIDNIHSSTHELDVDHSRKGVKMRLGKEGVFLTGPTQFKLSYTVQTTDLRLDGLQMFYRDMFPTNDEFKMNRIEYEIEFEEPLSGSYFIYPPTGEVIEASYSGGIIKNQYDQPLDGNTVTVEVVLPNDYFTFPNVNFVLPAFLGGVILAVIAVLFYLFFGKDPVVVETVEFTAPEGLSSAEIGYVYRGMTTSKDVVSLIVYWASLGFLRIHELEKDELALEKISDLPENWNVEEKRLFNAIFKIGEYVTLSELNNKIGETVMHVQSSLHRRFSQNPKLRIFDRKSSLMKALSIFIIPLIPAMMGYAVVFLKSSYKTDALVAFLVGYGVFLLIALVGSSLLAFDRVYKKNQRVLYALSVVALIMVVGFTLAIGFGAKDHKIYVLSTLLVYSIALFFTANTSRRTQIGADWVGQIRGLKRFIEVAEKDRLEVLVDETPEIFYNILPYAYVLGVTDIWIKKFEGIAMPAATWYVSSNPNMSTFIMMSSLNRSMGRMSSSLTSIPAPKSGSGGGSFGGGGGGGFSGGGFGGGSSGSW